MTDQHHADCLGAVGQREVRTPHLDSLVRDGVAFDHAYCNNPICAPSRASFMLGQYCHTHRMLGNRVVAFNRPRPGFLPDVFHRAGYRTGLFGKSHLPRQWVEDACERFRFVDLTDAWPNDPMTCHYFQWLADNGVAGYYEDGTARPGSDGHLRGTHPGVLPYRYTNEAYTGNETLHYLEETRDDPRPFFVNMSFERPHAPMRPALEYFDLYNPDSIELPPSAVDYFGHRLAGKPAWMIERLAAGSEYPLADPDPRSLKRVLAAYYALITCIDMEIGRVLDWLKANGQYDNTVIVFTADHGDFAGDHGLFHKNFGIYESIHRIPFIIKAPGISPGKRSEQIVESIDLLPTLCELAGIGIPPSAEGMSLAPLLRDPTVPGKDEALAEWVWFEPAPNCRINALRTKRFRIVHYGREFGGELYDHSADPGEVVNRWNDPGYADNRQEMTERLLDRVGSYACESTYQPGFEWLEDERLMASQTTQFGRVDWGTLQQTLTTPCPARQWPPDRKD